MPVILADDQTELSYRAVGTGSHHVVLVHGWMSTGAIYDRLLEQLPLRGLRVLIPDLRGAGASGPTRTDYRFSRLARDVLAIADAEGAQTFTLVGHSMGGQIALQLAVNASERLEGLFLICPVPATGQPLEAPLRALFQSSAGDAEKLGTILDLSSRRMPPVERERLVALATSLDARFMRDTFAFWSRGFEGGLDRIRTPTVVLATDDPYFSIERQETDVVSQIPDARLCYLPGSGHFPLVEQAAETAAVLSAFLGGLRPPPHPRREGREGVRLRAVRHAHG